MLMRERGGSVGCMSWLGLLLWGIVADSSLGHCPALNLFQLLEEPFLFCLEGRFLVVDIVLAGV